MKLYIKFILNSLCSLAKDPYTFMFRQFFEQFTRTSSLRKSMMKNNAGSFVGMTRFLSSKKHLSWWRSVFCLIASETVLSKLKPNWNRKVNLQYWKSIKNKVENVSPLCLPGHEVTQTRSVERSSVRARKSQTNLAEYIDEYHSTKSNRKIMKILSNLWKLRFIYADLKVVIPGLCKDDWKRQ